jgi:hypothetical protein
MGFLLRSVLRYMLEFSMFFSLSIEDLWQWSFECSSSILMIHLEIYLSSLVSCFFFFFWINQIFCIWFFLIDLTCKAWHKYTSVLVNSHEFILNKTEFNKKFSKSSSSYTRRSRGMHQFQSWSILIPIFNLKLFSELKLKKINRIEMDFHTFPSIRNGR